MKKTAQNLKFWAVFLLSASGRGRTDTLLRELDFESSASADSATEAWVFERESLPFPNQQRGILAMLGLVCNPKFISRNKFPVRGVKEYNLLTFLGDEKIAKSGKQLDEHEHTAG